MDFAYYLHKQSCLVMDGKFIDGASVPVPKQHNKRDVNAASMRADLVASVGTKLSTRYGSTVGNVIEYAFIWLQKSWLQLAQVQQLVVALEKELI